ncbi:MULTISPECIES: LuxR family transcriptional regulator [Pseudomonas]|uniref:LuxR family transcriptional regulator n=1 Tax=Pseudomonas donghuensis TaxID=1163398 RepID=A0AAP0XAI3_9PSED|nr:MULTISPECIES: LuxR family transcriptional regulator [Pseudomonas]MDF9893854.1 LuxR family transcriptional regulator [Pseudomonas vranovensis]KDO00004.1 LuxR family transcriptional regulator [Pseudomonas donghuensis]MBF4209487.1 LuxR family transcriptional regulator [Pseudomonas donghuensis]MBS7601419.1 LuxR family transcriptional regulator [Pseudomonas sp. RC2C2]MCP6694298.1 LuxR family transcriptional regulator [Pseudomonas donghuensis]
MQAKLADLHTRLASDSNLDEQMDSVAELAAQLGFDALVYDYSPVPLDHLGELITPSVVRLRQTPRDWQDLWCSDGFYQIDPVQQLAVSSIAPFAWSYLPKGETVLQRLIDRRHAPVVGYLLDAQLACGVTVPIHLPRGGLATLTGLRPQASQRDLDDAREHLADFSLIAHALQEAAYPLLGKEAASRAIRLTRRELECLRWAAEGLTAAQIAEMLTRSLATVSLHLTSAMHKLGAKNRVQAVARAVHYRLLDN